MNNKEFYVSLPSTGDSQNNPQNVQSEYSTYMNPPIVLDGQFKCGLSEISFSNDFLYNIGRVEIIINDHYIFFKAGKNIDKIVEKNIKNVKLPFVFNVNFVAQPKSNLVDCLSDALKKLKIEMFNHYIQTLAKYNDIELSFEVTDLEFEKK